MLTSVLSVLRHSMAAGAVVVGGDSRVAAISAAQGAVWKADRFNDLNMAVGSAFADVWRYSRIAAYIPADLPLLTAIDIDAAIALASSGERFTICPAHDGGTNGLFVPPGHDFTPRLGVRSYARHRELSLDLGVDMTELWSAGFERDVDTIEDLRWCVDSGATELRHFLEDDKDSCT